MPRRPISREYPITAKKSGRKRAPSKKAAPAAKRKSAKRGPSAYEKRIQSYLRAHPGATRQEARGHKPREHVTRRQKELDRLEAFAETQAARFRGADAGEILDALMFRYRRDGIGFLNRIEAWIARHHARYMAQTARDKKGRRPTLGINMDDMSEREELPPETFGYH